MIELATLQGWAQALGFQQLGVTDIELDAHADALDRWLAQGYHGDMDWLARYRDLRRHPDRLHPGTLRVISVRMDYLPDDSDLLARLTPDGHSYIARYALGRDYHKLIRKRLAALAQQIEVHTAHRYRAFADSAPILERGLAEKAGLGWIGKNTLLINSKAGSYFFLGEILTDLPLPLTPPQETTHCGSCTACLDACPTQAFVAPHVLDARRCISYLTIEYRGSIPLDLRPLIGNRIFGCDDCQAVCPWNKFAQPTREAAFLPQHSHDGAALAALLQWTEETYLAQTAGTPLRRIGHEGWLRNVAVALGNARKTPAVLAALQQQREHPSALVREHVEWALAQGDPVPSEHLAQRVVPVDEMMLQGGAGMQASEGEGGPGEQYMNLE